MKTYAPNDLGAILTEMQSYIQSADQESIIAYFVEIANTGLFHDAVGKIVQVRGFSIDVTTEY